MRHTMLTLGTALAILVAAGSAQAQQGGNAAPAMTPDMTDHGAGTAMAVDTATFVAMAASGNAFEIQSSLLAAEQASDPAVKAFATRMVTDHSAAGEAMAAALAEAGHSAPATALDARHQRMIETLTRQRGPTFDVAYVQMQEQAHRQTVALFGSYASSGDDPALRRFAEATLPTLQEHHRMAMVLPGSGVDATGATGTGVGTGAAGSGGAAGAAPAQPPAVQPTE